MEPEPERENTDDGNEKRRPFDDAAAPLHLQQGRPPTTATYRNTQTPTWDSGLLG